MKKTIKLVLLVLAGVIIGLAASAAMQVSASRPDGVIGGEVVIPLALPTLLAIGWWVGRDTPRVADYDRGWHDGHRQGVMAQQRLKQHKRAYDYDKDNSGL